MKSKLVLAGAVVAILVLIAYGIGCAGQQPPAPPPPPSPPPPVVSHGGPVKDYISLVDNLRAAGATVDPAGEVTQPFFSVKGLIINVNGDDVQVFEYEDATTADNEAALVSPDGSSVGTSMVGWVAPPHFYKVGNLIVLYVGESKAVIDTLESVVGSQFAGR